MSGQSDVVGMSALQLAGDFIVPTDDDTYKDGWGFEELSPYEETALVARYPLDLPKVFGMREIRTVGSAGVNPPATAGIPDSIIVADTIFSSGIVYSDGGSGRVTWTTGTIRYKGINYTIAAETTGDTNKYIYWDLNDTPTTLRTTDTLANAFGADKWVQCINDSGTPYRVGVGQPYHGDLVNDGTIGTTQMVDVSVTTAKLADLSVELGKMAANSVDKDKLTVLGVDADGKLVLGQIGSGDADNIDASATRKWAGETGADVTGSHQADVNLANLGEKDYTNLDYVPQDAINLISKPYFEDETRGKWSSGTVVSVSGQDFSKALQVSQKDTIEMGIPFPCKAGDVFKVYAHIRTVNANYATGIGIQFIKSDGSVAGWILGLSLAVGQDWTFLSGSCTAPSLTVTARPWIQMSGFSGFGTAEFTNLVITKFELGADVTGDNTAANVTGQGALATLNTVDTAQIDNDAIVASKILAGEIGTGHIAALAITAGKIAALAIETDKIAANAVTAGKITVVSLGAISAQIGDVYAGSLTGTVITGGTIRTATTGRRIKMDVDGIKFMTAAAGSGVIGTTANGGDNIKIGTTANGGDNEVIGTGYLVRLYNMDNGVPFYIQSEQTVADFHYFNRANTPSGASETGDTCVVQGKQRICTVSGTPGTWVVTGDQAA